MPSIPTITGTGKTVQITLLLLITIFIGSCQQSTTENVDDEEPVPKVKVTTIAKRDLEHFETIPATVIYFDKSNLTAPVTGFLTKVNVQTGDIVDGGQLLFELETKEHRAINKDSALRNEDIASYGMFSVKAPTSGYATGVMQQKGDFIQEGTSLCSFVRSDHILIEAYVPLNLVASLKDHPHVDLLLPDGQRTKAILTKNMNQIDPASQMLQVLFRPAKHELIPEGMNLQILIPVSKAKSAQILPKQAVLSNEKLNEFWVMVLKNDSTAIKTPVTIGTASDDSVEIKTPEFSPMTKILNEGNYGLPDTARVALIR